MKPTNLTAQTPRRARKNDPFSAAVVNKIQLKLPALSVNEGMARAAVAAFVSQLDPSVTELADIKCAVSEAVTNCIVHGYRERTGLEAEAASDASHGITPRARGYITITVSILDGRAVKIEVKDKGCGIPDVAEARKPLFTTDAAGERSGMGFTVMESFMDRLRVSSKPGVGTTVTMYRKLSERGRI